MLPLSTDMKLVHGILQSGVKAYYEARAAGVRKEILFPETQPIWELLEKLAVKGRIPSLSEVHSATGVEIEKLWPDPLDVELHAGLIVKRGLTGQIHRELEDITGGDAINSDPIGVRDRLTSLPQKLAWSYGEPFSINSRGSLDDLVSTFNRAASRGGRLLGLGSPWSIINEASLGLQPGELTVVFAKRKVGKCLAEDTLLHCPSTGAERTIGELHEDCVNDWRKLDWNVLTWKKNSPIFKTHPDDFMDVGEKECVEITYRSGRTMTVGLEHPMLTPRGWVNAQDLVEGHHTGSSVFMPTPTEPDRRMLDCEIKFFAYMIAEGGCTKPSTPTFSSSVPDLVQEMRECLDPMNCDLKPVKDREGSYYVVGQEQGHNMALNLLRNHGLMEKKSVEKVIPTRMFSLDDHQLGLFLGRLWSCDGSVEKSGMVSYSTGSKRMVSQVQHLLLRFGVTSRVRTRTVNDQDYYEIYVHRRCIERFKSHVKLIGPKAKKLQEVFFQGRDRVGFLKNEEIRDLVYAEMESRPDLLEEVGEELGYSFKFQKDHVFDSKSGRVRRKVFEAFCEIYGSELRWILDENLWWDEIASITPVGKRQCYDFSIPETECYIANDFIVHNSWLVIVWAVHIWKSDLGPDEKILFVTMEMTPLQVLQRLACVMLKFSWSDFHAGRLTTAERNVFDEWVESRRSAHPSDSNIVIVGSDQVRTVNDLSAVVGEYRPKAVVVDSFYIMGRSAGKSLHERVLANVQELKLDIAVRYNVPVLASTQLKGTTDKDVLMADSDDAMGAKAIGDYADATIGLFMDPALKAANQRLLRGMEARQFLPRGIKMFFDLGRMNFGQIEEVKELKKDPKADGGKKKPRPKKPTAEELAREDEASDSMTL